MVSMPAGREARLHKTRSNRDKRGCTVRMGSKDSKDSKDSKETSFCFLGVFVELVKKSPGRGGVTPHATSASY